MTKLTTCLVLLLFVKVSYCSWCDWSSWTTWSTCSQSCPGGTNDRVRYRRCNKKWTADECYTEQCSANQQYHDTKVCGDRCENGGTPEHPPHRCQCTDELWGVCCQNDCPVPKSCVYHYCDSAGDEEPLSVCMQCKNTTSAWNSVCDSTDPYDACDQCQDIRNVTGNADAYCYVNGSCHARCNWLGHDCWPGTCDTPQYLASSCQCIEGFHLSTPNNNITTCSLTHQPTVYSVDMGVEGLHGETENQTYSGDGNRNYKDLDFQPEFVSLRFLTSFELPVDKPSCAEKHSYIHDSEFGIVDVKVELQHFMSDGSMVELDPNVISSASCVTNAAFSKEQPYTRPFFCSYNYRWTYWRVNNGERICHKYTVTGSGYRLVKDLFNGNIISNKQFYNDVREAYDLCFDMSFKYTETDSTTPSEILSTAQLSTPLTSQTTTYSTTQLSTYLSSQTTAQILTSTTQETSTTAHSETEPLSHSTITPTTQMDPESTTLAGTLPKFTWVIIVTFIVVTSLLSLTVVGLVVFIIKRTRRDAVNKKSPVVKHGEYVDMNKVIETHIYDTIRTNNR